MNKLTVKNISALKGKRKITVLTAYDFPTAKLVDETGMDIVLVGDSVGMVCLGYESTLPVTMDDMLHHTRAVKRAVKHALLVTDMPFGSYRNVGSAVKNAKALTHEGGADAVKLEGGQGVLSEVKAIVRTGIPVMGHLGMLPQSIRELGGYKVQGKDGESARRLLAEAKGLAEAGAFALVLECIPDKLAGAITASIGIPTIGIGAGPQCDGQVLVSHDLLGMFEKFVPSFVKRYADLAPQIAGGIAAFRDEVKSGAYPDAEHSFVMQGEVADLLNQGKG